MIRKGLFLCLLTFVISALLFGFVYYGDGLIMEFKVAERVETLTISEISTYNPNATDGIYISFRYKNPKTGKEYSSPGIFTLDKSYKVGDKVEVVTRDGCPSSLLCETIRGRRRTILDRAYDVGYQRGMIHHLIASLLLFSIMWLPYHKMILEELRKRKKFIVITTTIYAIITVAACAFWIIAVHDNSWDALAYAGLSILIFAGGTISLLIAWLIYSVIMKKYEKRHNSV